MAAKRLKNKQKDLRFDKREKKKWWAESPPYNLK